MILLVAILLALFVLPEPWSVSSSSWAAWSRSARRGSGVVVEAAPAGGRPRDAGRTAREGRRAVPAAGQVRVAGELWTAVCAAGADRGDEVEIVAYEVDGLTLDRRAVRLRLKLTLEYDGTGFRGWAAQPGLRTVEGELRSALDARVPRVERARGRGAHRHGRARARPGRQRRDGGRPAAGARGGGAQRRAAGRRRGRLRRRRPPPDFHARHSARARSYRYRVFRRSAPLAVRAPPQPLVAAAARRGARSPSRRRSSSASTTSARSRRPRRSTRSSSASSRPRRGTVDGDALELEITADSFLRHMVRTLVGTMLELPPAQLAAAARGPAARRGGDDGPAVGALPRARPLLSARSPPRALRSRRAGRRAGARARARDARRSRRPSPTSARSRRRASAAGGVGRAG